MQTVQIMFSVPALVHTNLAKRANFLNIRPAEYARRLFEAAYASRIADERGTSSEDAALDNQVRQVFLLADCEPPHIAETLGMPEARVTRILDGWRTIASDMKAPAPTKSEPEAEVVPVQNKLDESAARAGGYPADQVETIIRMWAANEPIGKIATAIGRTEKAVSIWASRNRDVCPVRGKKA